MASWLGAGLDAGAQTRTLMFVPSTASGEVRIGDVESGPSSTVIAVGTEPIDAAVTPDGRRVWVLNRLSDTVSVIDIASESVIATVNVPTLPYAIAFAPNVNRAFVSSPGTSTLHVIDMDTFAVTSLPGWNNPQGLTVAPDGLLWLTQGGGPGAGSLTALNTTTLGVVANFFPPGCNWPTAMAISQDGTLGYVTCPTESVITRVTLPAGTSAGTALSMSGLFKSPVLSPDGATLYTVSTSPSRVAVIDLASFTLRATIDPGSTGLSGMGISRDGLWGYIPSTTADRVIRVDLTTNTVADDSDFGLNPTVGAFNNFVSPKYIWAHASPYDAGSDAALTADGFGRYIPMRDNVLRLTGDLTTTRHLTMVGDGGVDTNGHNATISGDLAGAGTFAKRGTGTLTFFGAASHGLTDVVAGTFALSGTHLPRLVVRAGARLMGAGTAGDIEAEAGSAIGIGLADGATAILDAEDVTLASTTTLTIDLNGTTAGTGFDRLNASGAVALNSATLDLRITAPFVPATDDEFLIATNVSGTFAGLAEGASLMVGASKFTVSYVGGNGNDAVLTAVAPLPPTISPIGGQTIAEDTTLDPVAVTVGDPDTAVGTLTVTATSSNQALVPDANLTIGGAGANRTIAATPLADAFGQTMITVTVSDGYLQDTTAFLLTVTDAAEAPAITAIGAQTIDEDAALAPVAFLVSDADTAVGTLMVTATSSNQALVPDASLTIGGAGANRTITATPRADAFGQTTITVTVSDGHLQDTTAFVLTVTSVADAPTISTIAAQAIDEDSSLAPVAFVVGDVDSPVDALTVTATSSNQALVPDASVTIGGVGANRTVAATPLADAFGQTTITVTVSDGHLQNTTAFLLTVTDIVEPVPPTTTYYFAEGATGGFFDTDILFANPNGQDVDAAVTFHTSTGVTVAMTRTLPAMSRVTIHVDEIPQLENETFSTTVVAPSDAPIAVERTMAWDESGYGAHTERATAGAAADWYFAEGAQGFFSTFLLLANPQASANSARVTYFREGEPAIVRDYPLVADERKTIDTGDDAELRNRSFGAHVSFTQPGVAERSMYFGKSPIWMGGTSSAGATAPSMRWLLAEGATGGYFTTFVLATNPGVAPAEATFTYLLASGTSVTRAHTIDPGQRLTLNVADEDPSLASAAMATQVEATQPIVVERAQYWGAPEWIEAHSSVGLTQAQRRWALAEGHVGGAHQSQTFILLGNAGGTEAEVTVTFLRTSGAPVAKTFMVPPTSRFTVAIVPGEGNMAPDLVDESFGARIDSTQPIFVERSIYSNANGIVWASGTNATATPIGH